MCAVTIQVKKRSEEAERSAETNIPYMEHTPDKVVSEFRRVTHLLNSSDK